MSQGVGRGGSPADSANSYNRARNHGRSCRGTFAPTPPPRTVSDRSKTWNSEYLHIDGLCASISAYLVQNWACGIWFTVRRCNYTKGEHPCRG